MKLKEQVEYLIKDIEQIKYPEDKNAYNRIYQYTVDFKVLTTTVYRVWDVMKEIENVSYMMACYLPKETQYDTYGSRAASNKEWNYGNLEREKQKLITSLRKLKVALDNVRDAEGEQPGKQEKEKSQA